MVHLRQRLAKFIKEKRGELPQRVFARKIGVAQSTIMRIENMEQNVTLDTLETLCNVFHVEIQELFPRQDTVKTYSPRALPGLNVPEASSALSLQDAAPKQTVPSTSTKRPAKR